MTNKNVDEVAEGVQEEESTEVIEESSETSESEQNEEEQKETEDSKEIKKEIPKVDYAKIKEKSIQFEKEDQKLFDEMYVELERTVMELKNKEQEVEDLKTKVTESAEEKDKISNDVLKKEEIIKIKEKQLEDIEKRVFQIEEEKRLKSEAIKKEKIENLVSRYISTGLISEENKEQKFNELNSLSENALEELSGVIERKLETIADQKITQSSEELKVGPSAEEIVGAKKEVKPQTRDEKMDELFAKMQAASQ